MIRLTTTPSLLLTTFFISFQIIAAHVGCGNLKPTERDFVNAQLAEEQVFGKTVKDMSKEEASALLHGRRTVGIAESNVQLQLTGIPIVYHILPNQDNGSKLRPRLTEDQAEWATNITNNLFRIYDKNSKTTFPFISFTHERKYDFKVHRGFSVKRDCEFISESGLRRLVKRIVDWKFKMHVVVCETSFFSSKSTLPSQYSPTDPIHNLISVDHRAMACYDDSGKFLCNKIRKGANFSKTRWWHSRSAVVPHGFGHLFGLNHLHEGCTELNDDGVFDTPLATTGRTVTDCPGLLPYDKDRDHFSGSRAPNVAENASQCEGEGKLCGQTCAACCDNQGGECVLFKSNFETLSQMEIDTPVCCPGDANGDIVVEDSCPDAPGIDPLNNVMSYAPDYCVHEFTSGQMLRMTAQIIQYKTYLYCNYGNILDAEKCSGVPCSTRATSPNCV